MITDAERIAAAEALRERAKHPLGKRMQLMFSETLGMYRTNICWAKPTKATETWDAIVRRLADLIDRPAVPAWETDDGYQVCGGCYREFHVEAPAAFRCGESVRADYCPRCGAPLEWIDE